MKATTMNSLVLTVGLMVTGFAPNPGPSSRTDTTGSGVLATEVTVGEGMALYRAARYREAAAVFAALEESHPDNMQDVYMHALAAWKSGDLEQAEHSFRTYLKTSPRHMKANLNLARVLMEDGRPEKALNILKETSPADASGERERLLGRAYENMGQTQKAVEAYRQAISRNRQDAWAMNNLGLIYIHDGRYQKALPPLARAQELRNDIPVIQNNLGLALEKSGYQSAARTCYAKAVGLDSTYDKAAENRDRLQNVQPDQPQDPDLAALADSFEAGIDAWHEQAAAAGATEN